MVDLRRFADLEALNTALAEDISRDAQDTPGPYRMALAGGSTPRRLYELLAASPFAEQIPWERVELFWGDERSAGPEHADSNYRMAHEALLGAINFASERTHRIEGEREDAAERYAAVLARVFEPPPAGVPVFERILLGLGPDGHTASLFPGTAALAATDWVVRNPVPQHDTHRFTLAAPVINAARTVSFLVSGAGKAEALAHVLEGPRDPDRWPAQLIAGDSVTFWIDEAAARDLSSQEEIPI